MFFSSQPLEERRQLVPGIRDLITNAAAGTFIRGVARISGVSGIS